MRALFVSFIFSAVAILPACAEDRLQVRPGMSLAEVTKILKPKCLDYIVGGNSEKYVTCIMGEGLTPAVVTATVTRKDRVEYIQWRDLVGDNPPPDHADITAKALGFSSQISTCPIYAEDLPCWRDESGTILYDAGYEAASGIHTFYLDNDGIRKADAE